MTTKLDIEGIRERHEELVGDIENLWSQCRGTPDASMDEEMIAHTDRGSLLTEIDRLQSELDEDALFKSNGELTSEVIRLRGELEWQPIENAPKDGTKILLGRIMATAGIPEFNMPEREPHIWWAIYGFWAKRYNNWNDGVEPSGLAEPTHWMPLPDPPEQTK